MNTHARTLRARVVVILFATCACRLAAQQAGPATLVPGTPSQLGTAGLRHTQRATAVTLSENGRVLASSGWDHRLRVWDVPSGAPKAALDIGHSLDALSLSADGSRVAGVDRGRAWVWDVASGGTVASFPAEGDSAVVAIALSADGTRAVTGDEGGTVRNWALGEAAPLRSWALPDRYAVRVLDLGPTSWRAATGADDEVCVWAAGFADEAPRRVARCRPVLGLGPAIALRGERVAFAAQHCLVVWQLDPPRAWRLLPGDYGSPLALSSDGKLLAVSDGNTFGVHVWQVDQLELVRVLAGHGHPIAALAIGAADALLASASDDTTLGLWQLEDGRPLAAPTGHRGPVYSIAELADGTILTAGDDLVIRAWTSDGRLVSAVADPSSRDRSMVNGTAFRVAVSADGQRMVSVDWDGIATLWNRSGPGWRAVSRSRLCEISGSAEALAALPDGGFLTLSPGGSLLRSNADAAAWTALEPAPNYGRTLAVRPDGTRAVVGGQAGLELYDLATSRHIAHVAGERPTALAWTPDGTGLLVVHPRAVWLCDPDGAPVALLAGNLEGLRAIAVSPDGERVVVAGGNRLTVLDLGRLRAGLSEIATATRDLADPAFATRERAMETLRHWGRLAVPTLTRAAADPDRERAWRADAAKKAIEGEAPPPLDIGVATVDVEAGEPLSLLVTADRQRVVCTTAGGLVLVYRMPESNAFPR